MVIGLVVAPLVKVVACTNILVGRNALTDVSVFMTYCFDGYGYYDSLRYSPSADHASGEKIIIYDIDYYKYLGSIPQVEHTKGVYIEDGKKYIGK